METTHTCRLRPTTPTPPSPRLQRSRSGAPAISPLEQSRTCNNSSLNSLNRSKSTTRSRTSTSQQQKNEEYVHPSTILASMQQKKTKESNDMNKDGFVRFLQRGIPRNNNSAICSSAAKIKSTKSVKSSPSAWALSPGRSSPYLVAPESPRPALAPVPAETRRAKSSAVGGVSGVLKYFRQKKVSPVQEGEYNRFRVLHNTLVLYRFANARAEVSMASLKNVSELDGKNCEAVSRVTRKLSALSVKVPFEDAKADVESVYDAMNKALAVMDGIEETVKRFLPQAEKMLYMLTELITTAEGEEEYLKELDTIFPLVPSLMEW
ncbi:QWRF motif-containing protein 7-like [Pistacia vera]|uniref:QWRF motif-containing protein 7-like n=1 Tax=Pistacia vera TaxID=55513 RepID=UPI001263CD3A|nr:QWRF motif-containing protein 7-like [Pistacia vera]